MLKIKITTYYPINMFLDQILILECFRYIICLSYERIVNTVRSEAKCLESEEQYVFSKSDIHRLKQAVNSRNFVLNGGGRGRKIKSQ